MLKVLNIPAGIEGTGIHPDFKSLILSGENRWQWHIINSVSALEFISVQEFKRMPEAA
ncbi:MAG: hypothetical protein O6918_01815 [Deltaproteobacteria bacterium]|nr:hypothetical protein [Deltaproteobacteria bacterium]